MPPPHVLVLHNEPVLPRDHPDATSEHDILNQAAEIASSLRGSGFTVSYRGVGRDPLDLVEILHGLRPEAVFNLFEGLATDGQTEATAAGIMEWLGVSFTGSPAATLTIGRDKMLTKRLLLGSGLPTPAFFVVEQLPCPPCGIDWPVIVKPGRQDGSVGIEQASVVTSQPQLERQVAAVLERYGTPALVEQFIHGRELHATLIEEFNPKGDEALPTVLPLTEVRFDDDNPSVWPIYSFDAKWAEESREYETTPLICPVPLEPALHARLDRLAIEAFRLLGCRDYGRVDFRMTPEGEFYILEVNPNPFINNLALRDGLEVLGRTPKEFIANLMRRALARGAARGRAGQGSMSVA